MFKVTSVILFLLAWGNSALAQSSTPVDIGLASADLTELLKRHVDEGTRASQAGEYQRAVDAFAVAYALMPAPDLLFALAKMHRSAGHDREVVALLGRYLHQGPQDTLRTEAEAHQAQARDRLRANTENWEEDADRVELLKSHVKTGTGADASGQYGRAAEAYAAAYALESVPTLLFNLAQVQRKGEHYREALVFFERFLGVARQSELRAEAEQGLVAVKGKLKSLSEGAEATRRLKTIELERLSQQERRRRRLPLRAAAWVLAGAGLAGVIAGATLWGLDGHQSCAKAATGHCEVALAGRTPGIALVAGGGVLVGTAGLLLGVDYGKAHTDVERVQPALLTLSWGY